MFKSVKLCDIIEFNPSESIEVGALSKKISMDKLSPFYKFIKGYEKTNFTTGTKFRNHDTLVAKITPCLENGKTAFLDILKDNEVAFGSSEFIVLRAKSDKILPDFIYYLAISPMFRARAISCMEGTSGRKRVNEQTLKNHSFPIPEIKEQRQIAAVLSSIDKKIQLNEQINQNLEIMAKQLYDYWFIQFEFPDKNGNPYKSSGGRMVWNEKLKRKIPSKWDVEQIENILDSVQNTKRKETSEYLMDGKYPIIDQSSKYIVGYTNDSEDVVTRYPAVVFGDHTRNVKIVDFSFARGADGTQIMYSNNERVPQHYFYFSVSNIDLSNYGYARHYKFLKERYILLPELEVSSLFEKYVSLLYKKIKYNTFNNIDLAKLRDKLLPLLMNGQVSVNSDLSNY